MIKKICLITPSHISSNPRLIKEASTLIEYKYKVHIVFAQTLAYLSLEDEKLLCSFPEITYNIVKNSGLINKIAHKIVLSLAKLKNINFFNNYILNRDFDSFLKKATACKADLYIAHNLAALPIAVEAATRNKSKCGFDAEDFHRNELNSDSENFHFNLKSYIEDKYIPQVSYFTAASPLIAQTYKSLYPNLNPITINNVFELKYQPTLNLNENKELKLFWFSQTIGKNRGLEDIIQAINQIDNPLVELHLLGKLAENEKVYFNKMANFLINYHIPISGNKIFEFSNQFDIGLALEPAFSINNNIALSNKIFSYLITGLAVIATDTLAQKQFMTANPTIGQLYKIGDVKQLKDILNILIHDREKLNTYKKNAYNISKEKYNWENESLKFISIINNIS